jgi:hypothetical protein
VIDLENVRALRGKTGFSSRQNLERMMAEFANSESLDEDSRNFEAALAVFNIELGFQNLKLL